MQAQGVSGASDTVTLGHCLHWGLSCRCLPVIIGVNDNVVLAYFNKAEKVRRSVTVHVCIPFHSYRRVGWSCTTNTILREVLRLQAS